MGSGATKELYPAAEPAGAHRRHHQLHASPPVRPRGAFATTKAGMGGGAGGGGGVMSTVSTMTNIAARANGNGKESPPLSAMLPQSMSYGVSSSQSLVSGDAPDLRNKALEARLMQLESSLRETDAHNEALERRLAQANEELRLLRKEKLAAEAGLGWEKYTCEYTLTQTVCVPPEFEPIFKKAEAAVASFFQQKVHDPSTATLSIMGSRYLMIRAPAVSVEFYDVVTRVMGPERRAEAFAFTRQLLYELANGIGFYDCRNFADMMNVTDPLVLLSAGTVHFAFAGWGFVSIAKESTPIPASDKFYLLYDHPCSFEADAFASRQRKVNAPVCMMNAGYSAGWCSHAFQIQVCAVEILCKARGDPCCRFIMCTPSRVNELINIYKHENPSLNIYQDFELPGIIAKLEDGKERAVKAEEQTKLLLQKVEVLQQEKAEINRKVIELYQ
eukprot:TRINITY_DN918_c0_g2_i1.p1 TRINITY_DN918_c0_g2~~TRINITY_DN918_c0_g2_i1.p1  ORF type:complete len:445 (-),score=102.94 TRINITY_DN918_c0_g2_i1:113-1447(-)